MTGDIAIIHGWIEIQAKTEELGIQIRLTDNMISLKVGDKALGTFFKVLDVQMFLKGLERGKRPL